MGYRHSGQSVQTMGSCASLNFHLGSWSEGCWTGMARAVTLVSVQSLCRSYIRTMDYGNYNCTHRWMYAGFWCVDVLMSCGLGPDRSSSSSRDPSLFQTLKITGRNWLDAATNHSEMITSCCSASVRSMRQRTLKAWDVLDILHAAGMTAAGVCPFRSWLSWLWLCMADCRLVRDSMGWGRYCSNANWFLSQ